MIAMMKVMMTFKEQYGKKQKKKQENETKITYDVHRLLRDCYLLKAH
jgi:hypothetical protein